MAHPPNHTFSPAAVYTEDKLLRIDRQHNALTINLPAHASHVVEVNDTSPWESAAELGAAATFGGAPGALGVAVNSAAARSVLRPASQGTGRPRFRQP